MHVNGNIQFSRPQRPEGQPAFANSKEGPVQTGTGQVSGASQEVAASLPPFPVLLQWLEFYHSKTGYWPEPELLSEATFENVSEKPLLTLLSNRKVASFTPDYNRNSNTEEGKGNTQTYNFRASVYYQAAIDLIKKQNQASPLTPPFTVSPTAGSFSQGALCKEETVLTLASFLAWCCLPSLEGEGEAKGNKENGRMEMYLSLDCWSRVLKMRKATLSRCLKELAAAGLLEITSPDNAAGKDLNTNTNKRGNNNRVYRLAVPLLQPLPPFNPIQNPGSSPINTSNVEPPKKAGEPELKQFQAQGTGLDREPDPVNMIHVNDFKNIKNINTKILNHGHDRAAVEPGTGEEKLLFLLEAATFPGYISPDGLSSLARGEAQKFAADSQLDLASIKRIYHQALSAWTTGKCTKNPIGFFHHSLTRHLNGNHPESGAKAPARVNVPPTGKALDSLGTGFPPNNGSHSQNAALHKEKSLLIGTKTYQSPVEVFDVKDLQFAEEEQEQAESVSGKGSKCPEVSQEFDPEKIKFELQGQVVQALQNRFKRPDLAATLSQLEWSISISQSKVRLALHNPASNFLAIPGLNQGDLSLIQIVVSQGVRLLTGKSFEIEISPVPGPVFQT